MIKRIGFSKQSVTNLINLNRHMFMAKQKNLSEISLAKEIHLNAKLDINRINSITKKSINSLLLNLYQTRTKMRGGAGYTNFGHGRNKTKLSKVAYLWYAFLLGSVSFITLTILNDFIEPKQDPNGKFNNYKIYFDRKGSQ
jgi:hypothetical protein